MNALVSFFKSKDGLVAVATLVLLGVVSHYSDPYNAWINLLARVGNVCVFLYILWRAGGKAIVSSLRSRRANIAEELDSLAQRKREAEEQLRELQSRIANLNAEREAILDESRAQGEALKASLIAEARAEAETIREQAVRTADTETKGAADALRNQIADEIIEAVEASLKERLNANKHAKLIDNALKKVVLN